MIGATRNANQRKNYRTQNSRSGRRAIPPGLNLRNDSLGTNAGSQFYSCADFSKGGGLVKKEKVCDSSQVSGKVAESKPKRKPATPQARVESELRKLQRLTKDAIPEDKRNVVLGMLPNLAFMKYKLDEARKDLLYESIYTEYDNGGGQSGLREHPGFQAYNKLFTTFQRGIKQLCDLMPTGAAAADALTDYLAETRYD